MPPVSPLRASSAVASSPLEDLAATESTRRQESSADEPLSQAASLLVSQYLERQSARGPSGTGTSVACSALVTGNNFHKPSTQDAVRNVAEVAGRLGLPTHMLQAALHRDSFGEGGDENYVSRLTGRLYLAAETANTAALWRDTSGRGLASAVSIVYHEATHQYLKSSGDPRVEQFVADGTAAYSPADVASRYPGLVEPTNDPLAVFQEAVGNYVDHRVLIWESTRAALDSARRVGSLTNETVQRLAEDYNNAMTERTFGYQTSSVLALGEPEHKATIMPMPESIRAFVDEALLERRFVDNFNDDPVFRAYSESAERGVCE